MQQVPLHEVVAPSGVPKMMTKNVIVPISSEQIGARLDPAQARLGPMGPPGRCRGLISASRGLG
jgi:hypothetical protein